MADKYDATKDRYLEVNPAANNPAWRNGIPITKSDTKDVTNATGDASSTYLKGIYVGVSGDIAIIHASDSSNNGDGTAVLYKAVPVGVLWVQARRVMSTNTTATNMVGLYDQ